jgi:DNA-binding NtrC family response regulator
MNTPKTGDRGNSKPTIFVVDDEPMLLDMAAAILEPLGFEVRKFRDPRKALEEIPAARPVVIVTDYSMGPMNGVDFVSECKRSNPAQKMLLVSGTVDETVYADSPFKPDRFLAKPYAVADFVGIIESLSKA